MNNRITNLLLILAILVVATGCISYNEKFTYVDPRKGTTNQIVHVSYIAFFVWGEAAKLKTETQTAEFIRTVNAEEVKVKVDADGIRATGEAVGNVAGEIGKKIIGVPLSKPSISLPQPPALINKPGADYFNR